MVAPEHAVGFISACPVRLFTRHATCGLLAAGCTASLATAAAAVTACRHGAKHAAAGSMVKAVLTVCTFAVFTGCVLEAPPSRSRSSHSSWGNTATCSTYMRIWQPRQYVHGGLLLCLTTLRDVGSSQVCQCGNYCADSAPLLNSVVGRRATAGLCC
jgi:hypothetical protein